MKKTIMFLVAAGGILGAQEAGPPAQVSRPTTQAKLFQALSKVEGCVKWRNPGCLKFAAQPGAERGPLGYAVFKTLKQGQDALRARIQRGTGSTVLEFLRGFNPGRLEYPARVAQFAGVDLEEVM